MKKTILFIVVYVCVCAVAAQAGTVIVIGNKGVGLSSVSRVEIQQIFLGKAITWSDGKKVTPVIQNAGRVQEGFLKNFLGKTPAQFDTFWKQAIFTGTGRPPKSVASDADVVQFVGSTDGAVGYIDSDTPLGDTKKLEVK